MDELLQDLLEQREQHWADAARYREWSNAAYAEADRLTAQIVGLRKVVYP